MDRFTAPLLEGCYYHIYNRANSGRKLFYHNENYDYFLDRFNYYLSEFVELYSFCLVPNHFHMLIKVIRENLSLSGFGNRIGYEKSAAISKAFSNFFNSYSKSINNQENLFGNIFQRPFKRVIVGENDLLLKVVYYIHQNPIHHGLCKELEEYKWSSYFFIINKIRSMLNDTEVLRWFGSIDEFMTFHKTMLLDFKENFVIE